MWEIAERTIKEKIRNEMKERRRLKTLTVTWVWMGVTKSTKNQRIFHTTKILRIPLQRMIIIWTPASQSELTTYEI